MWLLLNQVDNTNMYVHRILTEGWALDHVLFMWAHNLMGCTHSLTSLFCTTGNVCIILWDGEEKCGK